jgi:hypothetical protein
MMCRKLLVLIGFLFVFLVPPLQAGTDWNANSMWIERSGERSFALEVAIPDYEKVSIVELSGQIYQLSYNGPINDRIALLFELPVVNGEADVEYGRYSDSESETMIGNPYIGFDFASRNRNLSTEVGGRLPLSSDDDEIASAMGVLGDMERLDAYIPDCYSLGARVKYQTDKGGGPVACRLQAGPVFLFNADDYFEDDNELFLNYGGFVGVQSKNGSIMAGMTGYMIISESDLDFDERTQHYAGVTAGVNVENVQLGLYFKTPLDDEIEKLLDDVIGFYVTWSL